MLLTANSAYALRDAEARAEIEVLRQRLNQVESSLQVRQMGLGEQLQVIREDMARIESKIDENVYGDKLLQERLDVRSIETRDSLLQINENLDKRLKTVDENAGQLANAITELQKNIQVLSDNLQTMSDFEKQQEGTINSMRGQLQENLDIIVEEVGKENLQLQKDIAAIDGQVQQFKKSVGSLDSRIRSLSAEIQDLSRRQKEAASAPAPAAGGRHTVQRGESLSSIARSYGVSVDAIMAVNGISDPNILQVGQSLVIPGR